MHRGCIGWIIDICQAGQAMPTLTSSRLKQASGLNLLPTLTRLAGSRSRRRRTAPVSGG
jgi:hypothetical protein